LDGQSYFSSDLFRLCLWIADYYFANPADCLIAALPGMFKSARSVRYVWRTEDDEVLKLLGREIKPGRTLSDEVMRKIKSVKGLLTRLLSNEVIEEDWIESPGQSRRPSGYRMTDTEAFDRFFKRRKTELEPFDSLRTRPELKASGWTDYLIRQAIEAKLLLPVFNDATGNVLDFIKPRKDIGEILLNSEQQQVVDSISKVLSTGFSCHLLHGVTGSGKTIVYCHLCQKVIDNGFTALVLTPEIALAGSTLAYFRGFFGDKVTIVHSAMTEPERLESWRGIRSGRFKVVIGPRSALFAPAENLGLIVVDEEHDPSYKQDNPAPRFHGRDAAIMRARINNVPVLLGSASPSFESYHNVQSGRYQLLRLTKRPLNAKLPTVRLVDMRTDRLRGDLGFFSLALKQQIEKCLNKDEQVILYLNRRGHSPQVKCADCGYVPQCCHCQVNMTYHKIGRKMSCHYCGRVETTPDQCPKCKGDDLMFLGAGTQKVEESIPRLLDTAKVARLDSDTASGRKGAHQILSDFASKKYNLLLGTQMVTKGLDFPGVTLVGVLSADLSLDLPDFRASEKTFARLLQVSGRSGRAGQHGEVLIQTYYPDSDLIDDAARQDYESFYNREIENRRGLDYPPFSRLINFTLSGKDESKLQKAALEFRDRLLEHINSAPLKPLTPLGPAPCPLYRLRGNFRRHLFVKTHQVVKFVKMLREWELSEPRFKLPSTIKLSVDIDPDDLM
jgi:primosomal protein N' (replication factor Y)